jgi:hypothetical protein
MLKAVAAWAIKAALFILLVDGIFGLFGVISIWRGNPYRLYYRARLASEVESALPKERGAPDTGWPAEGIKLERDHPPLPRKCGSAWGGSFTLSPDVPDESAWPYLVSKALGCEIANYGVPAYAIDQTFLLYQKYSKPDSLVVLGMSMPMITTAAVSSLTFMDLKDGLPGANMTKPFFTLDGDKLVLHRRPEPTVKAILDYYKQDGYGGLWTPLTFPFTRSVIRAVHLKMVAPDMMHDGSMSPGFTHYRAVASATIAAMASDAIARGDHFVLLMIPPPISPSGSFGEMLRAAVAPIPGVCFVDPTEEINKAKAKLANAAEIATESGHFSATGDAAIASALVRGIAGCGISP